MTQLLDTAAPKLSVVIPTHNVATWVRELLRSVLRQDEHPIEVIVVDDHSSDGTCEIVEAIATTDSRVTLHHAIEPGGANARNFGAGLARGKYLIFADGDDIVPGNAYAPLIASLDASGSDVAVGNFLKFSAKRTWEPGKNWKVFGRPQRATTLAERPALVRGRACWNKMFVTAFWADQGIRFPEVPRSNDIVPMIRALTCASAVDIVSDVVYLYRDRPGSNSMTARAGRSASLLSYLQQEVECATLILATGADAVINEYFALFCHADGWVHLAGYRRSIRVEPDLDATTVDLAADALGRFLALVPAAVWARVPPRRRRVLRLFADREFALLSRLDVEGRLGADDPEASVASFERMLESAAILLAAEPAETELLAEALRRCLLDPLLLSARSLSSQVVCELTSRVAQFHGLVAVPTVIADSLDSAEMLRVCLANDAGEVRRLSEVVFGFEVTADSVTHVGGAIGVNLAFSEGTEQVRCELIARLRGTDRARRWAPSESWTAAGGRFARFALSASDLRQVGTWDTFVHVTSGQISFERLLTVNHPRERSPKARAASLVILEVAVPGYALVLVRVPDPIKRAAQRAVRQLRRGR
ncbi:MAG: glycosyltransferase [Cryobacterium sp.]|nr:glycosyltransferase [Cryobacterium sp.]